MAVRTQVRNEVLVLRKSSIIVTTKTEKSMSKETRTKTKTKTKTNKYKSRRG